MDGSKDNDQGSFRKPAVIVHVYPIAGRQLFFRVPDRWCEECDLTMRTVKRVVGTLGDGQKLQVVVRPWLNYLPQALLHGGWHPPVVVINGTRFSQGVVPDPEALAAALHSALRRQEATHNGR